MGKKKETLDEAFERIAEETIRQAERVPCDFGPS